MNSIFTKVLLLTFYCIMLTVFCGCASLQQKDRVLAVVEGEPITEGDLLYSLSIAHRKEDLSSGGAIKISEYLNKMVDDRLIIDEARRAGMDQYPEVRKAIEAYILRESVVRLYGDEIVQKVSITDEDIQDFYKKNYERFVLDFIEVTSEDKAKEILDQLKQGANFEELASKFSIHASGKEGGKVVLKRNGMSTYILDAVSRLKPGELSDVIKILNKYYIVKFISSE
jgi:peptidyl-prolyl cis-trans isomerase C